MRNLRLTIAYDGTEFSGWQFQPDVRTVQAVLEAAIEEVTGVWTRVCASSRTDAGVHALGQVVSFPTETRLDNDTLRRALNAVLPFDVSVHKVSDAPPDFHATRDSVRKRYRYVMQDGRIRDPIGQHYAWFVPHVLDLDAMQEAAHYLIGTHDFAAYETTGSARETTVRTVYDLKLERRSTDHGERIMMEVEADGFLYNMVRNFAGSMVMVGRRKVPPSWLADVLVSLDRRRAGMTAPPHGLFLLWVKFACDEAEWDA